MVYDSQDCLATIPPYPHYIGDRGADYDVASSISDPYRMWIVCPQHFFKCTLRPLNTTKHDSYYCCPEDIHLNMVFFSAFEDLRLRTTGAMESNRIRKLYEPSAVPTLYVGRAEELLGRVPLFPCFLNGNTFHSVEFEVCVHGVICSTWPSIAFVARMLRCVNCV
jgi:hypothetical protein